MVLVAPDAYGLTDVFEQDTVDSGSLLRWSVTPVAAYFGDSSMQTQYLQTIEGFL